MFAIFALEDDVFTYRMLLMTFEREKKEPIFALLQLQKVHF